MNLKFLSKNEPTENTFLWVPRLALGLMGQYPTTTTTPLRSLNSAFHFTIYFLGTLSQFAYAFKADLYNAIHAICTALSCAVGLVKMSLIVWHGKELASVLRRLIYISSNEKKEKNKKILRSASANANVLAFLGLVIGLTTCFIYGIRPLLSNAYRLHRGLSYDWDDMPLLMLVPTVLLMLPWYPITYPTIMYIPCVSIFAINGADGIFMSFCFYVGALLRIIQNDMTEILEQFEGKYNMRNDEFEVCCRAMGNIVDRQNELRDLVKEFSTLYTLIILVHFGTSALVIGASVIEAMLYGGFRAIFYASFTATVTFSLFTYCYGGNTILINSSEFGVAVYSCNWYTYDIKVQKMILLMIARSQKPLNMVVPFFKPSLETFSSIIRGAGSVVALVKSLTM